MVHGFIICPGSAPSAAFCGVVGGASDLGEWSKRKRPAGWQSCETRVSMGSLTLMITRKAGEIKEGNTMKNFCLQFVGNVAIREYGIFLDDSGLESAIRSALKEKEVPELDFLGAVRVEIESIKNAGFQVVMDV